MNILKQSTAATIKLGPFVDDTDGKTAETALTIGQADIRLSKNGGDIAQSNNTAGATHDELGYYDIPLNTTDTDTLGRLRVLVSKAGALPVWQDFLIVTANVFDTLCSTGSLNVNATIDASGLATEATLNAVKAKTDQLVFVNNKVDANATATVDTSGLALEITQQGILSMLSSDPLPVRIDGIVGSTITVTRGNDWMIPIEGLTLNGKIQLAIKRNDNQPDDRSALFVDSATGLITLNGKPATDPTLASLTYAGGILTLSVDASITAQLSAVSYRYGIQSVGGTVSEKYGGEFVVNADIVRATE